MKKEEYPRKGSKNTSLKNTSWEKAAPWYNQLMDKEKSYYHEKLILPKIVEKIGKGTICDFGCGQGILLEKIGTDFDYLGIDLAPSLLQAAKKRFPNLKEAFLLHDVTKPISFAKAFDNAVTILAIQNIDPLIPFLQNCERALSKEGRLHIVMNHPCFRVPRQSSWGQDEKNKIQYRRIDRYMSPMKIPIQTHPGKKESPSETLSFHRPLSAYFDAFRATGFCVTELEEWVSPKKSDGAAARKENLARNEIPLFLYIQARKLTS